MPGLWLESRPAQLGHGVTGTVAVSSDLWHNQLFSVKSSSVASRRKGADMDVFALRDNLVGDYSSFVESFINIRDSRISQQVEQELV